MKKQLTLKVKPSEAADDNYLKKIVAVEAGCKASDITGYSILRKSMPVAVRCTSIFLLKRLLKSRTITDHSIRSILEMLANQRKELLLLVQDQPVYLRRCN